MVLETETKICLWQDILLDKYVKGKCIFGIKSKVGDSHFWSSLLKVKDLFYQHVKKKLEMEKILDSVRIGG